MKTNIGMKFLPPMVSKMPSDEKELGPRKIVDDLKQWQPHAGDVSIILA
jgi:hypothetical protein